MSTKKEISYPFAPPPGYVFEYTDIDQPFMTAALLAARDLSLDAVMPTGSVVASPSGKIIGRGGNGSAYHQTHECERVRLKIPTGQGYELCEGCHPKNHSERKAIADARDHGRDTSFASLYLWGHWWCCEPCWQAITSAGITHVYLLTDSEILFNKDHPRNIVGRQFAHFSDQRE